MNGWAKTQVVNLWADSPILVWLNSHLILTIKMECPPKLPCKMEKKYLGSGPGPFSTLAFHEKVAIIPFGEILSSFVLPEVNLLAPWGSWFIEVLLNAWACFMDGSSKLKCNSIHWDIAPVETQHQLYRIENRHGYSAQPAELKIIYLVNTALDELCFYWPLDYCQFLNCWFASGKLQTGILKTIFFICLTFFHYCLLLF